MNVWLSSLHLFDTKFCKENWSAKKKVKLLVYKFIVYNSQVWVALNILYSQKTGNSEGSSADSLQKPIFG